MDDSAKKPFMPAPFMPADVFGRSLAGFGVNILVSDVAATLAFLKEVLTVAVVHADADFAVCSYEGRQWLLHSDASYHSNPLLALTGDGAIRGAGMEPRPYGVDPDTAAARTDALGFTVLPAPAATPHGLRAAYNRGPHGKIRVP